MSAAENYIQYVCFTINRFGPKGERTFIVIADSYLSKQFICNDIPVLVSYA